MVVPSELPSDTPVSWWHGVKLVADFNWWILLGVALMSDIVVTKEELELQYFKDATADRILAYLEERLRMELVVKLAQIRKELGVTQAALARKTNTTQPMISRFFSGEDKRSPSLQTVVKMAWGLNREIRIELVELPRSLSSFRKSTQKRVKRIPFPRKRVEQLALSPQQEISSVSDEARTPQTFSRGRVT